MGHIKGGFPVGSDGRVHTIFTNAPSTLRTSTRSPNLQNLPRGADELEKLVKRMFVAPDSWCFRARDFKGIEAVLVGWLADSARYTRLAKLGVHDYFLAHGILKPQGLITNADLPDLSWSDDDLAVSFAALKKAFKPQREVAKRCVHASNYCVTPGKIHEEYPEDFPTRKLAAITQGAYYELFKEIPEWHWRLCRDVDKKSYCRAADGFITRYYRVLEWKKVDGTWEPSFGDDAKRAVSFQPQHLASFIGKEAMKRIFNNYSDIAKWMRLFIHDEIFCEVPTGKADYCDQIMKLEMERPVKELPLDPTWNMGEWLSIATEAKGGPDWGSME
jgi:hypothetical protein